MDATENVYFTILDMGLRNDLAARNEINHGMALHYY